MDHATSITGRVSFRKPSRVAPRFAGQRVVCLPKSIVAGALSKPITSNLCPTATGFYPSAARHFCERDQGIADAIIIYCVRGHGWARVLNAEYMLRQNDVLIVPAAASHAYGALEKHPWTIYWCHASG